MTYSISKQSGNRDIVADVKQLAEPQIASPNLSDVERNALNDSVNDVEKIVGEECADGDQVTVSMSGHSSRSDTGFSVSRNFGIQIDKRGRASYAAGAAGVPESQNAAGNDNGAGEPVAGQ